MIHEDTEFMGGSLDQQHQSLFREDIGMMDPEPSLLRGTMQSSVIEIYEDTQFLPGIGGAHAGHGSTQSGSGGCDLRAATVAHAAPAWRSPNVPEAFMYEDTDFVALSGHLRD
jgi:hypothetical protein